MIKKMFIFGLVVCSLLIVSSSSVVAVDKTLKDSEDDVVNLLTDEKVSSSPNIDITEMTYSKQGKTITLTLEAKGNIENRGSIDDLESEDNMDVIAYSLNLVTSPDNESYDVYYINNECQITYYSTGETENISETDFSVVGSILTVSFDLLSNDETYGTIEAIAEYYKISGEDFAYLMDDVVTLEVIADGPSEGKIGENIDFSGEASGGNPEYTWLWNFDDGNTSTVQNPIHSYAEAGTYEVILSVTDSAYNEANDSLAVTISNVEPSNGGDNNGGNNEESSNSGLILFVVIIAIIAIAGIAVVVYIIRR